MGARFQVKTNVPAVLRSLLAAIGALGAASCAALRPPSAPLDPPAMPVRLVHHVGTPWSGPLPAPQPPDAARASAALPLRCRVAVVEPDESPPGAGGEAIGGRARLIVATRGLEPILGAAGAADGVRIDVGAAGRDSSAAEPPANAGPVVRLLTAVPDGVTATISADLGDRFGYPEREFLRFGIAAFRCGDGIAIVADFERVFPAAVHEIGGVAGAADAPDGFDNAVQAIAPIRILADVAAVLVPGGPPVRLSAPAPFPGHAGARVVIEAEVPESVPPEALAAALSRCERDAAESSREEALRGPLSTGARFQARIAAGALEAMADPVTRRSAVVLLADACGSRLGADVAIAADDAMLERFAAHLAESMREDAVSGDDVRWAFERSTYGFLVALREATTLPPALLAVLARHAGEAARFPATLLEIAEAATGFADMDARLAEENRARLDDSSESVRVRAFDWLERRSAAPAGYDPLAPRSERRAALKRLAEEEAASRAAGTPGSVETGRP